MKTGIFSELSATGKLGIFLVTIIVSLLIFALIGVVFAYLYTGFGITNPILTNYSNSDTITYMKLMQIFQAIGIFIVPPVIALFIFKKQTENYLQFNKTKIIFIFVSAISMIIALPFINWLAEINQGLSLPNALSSIENWMHTQEALAESVTKHFLKADNLGVLSVNLFMMALLPAIGEEMVFRGVLQKLFVQMTRNTHIAIWVTAFLFSAIHMQFFTFLPRFFMGAMFGYMLVWSGSIWLPITAHFINNGIAVVANYLVQKKTLDEDFENLGADNTFYWVATSIMLIIALMYYLYKNKITTETNTPGPSI